MVGAGELDKRIELFAMTLVDTGLSTNEVMSSVGSVWAKATPISDGERFRAGAVSYQLQMRFIIRNRQIDENFQIEYKGKRFAVYGIKEIEGNFIEITAGLMK